MEPNAILAISSLDRYNKNQGTGGQFASTSEALANQYNGTGQPCNNFQVGGFGALIYGYIKKIIVSQTQLQYNVPTVIPGANDDFFIYVIDNDTSITTKALITIPYGYYTPEELAPVIEEQIQASALPITDIEVIYSDRGSTFTFKRPEGAAGNYYIYFPNIAEIKLELIALGFQETAYVNILKCYKLLGMDIVNSNPAAQQISNVGINFLYTAYVDIFSTALTKYQRVKDNTTNASSDSTLIARIFLSGEGTPQNTGGEEELNGAIQTSFYYPLGSRPFVVVQDCNTPKIIRWSKDETVYALDFQLRDQYGDLLYTQNETDFYYTEFQMTLMCVEGGRE